MRTVTIVSCAREPSYLAETLRGFTDPEIEVEIFYQSKEHPGEIPALQEQYAFSIPRVYLTEKMYDKAQLNGQYNYAETLLNTKDGLILEDDVQVSKNFVSYLKEIERLIPDERSIVTLYSRKQWRDSGKLELIKLAPSHFRNTQAMFYPVPVARAFGQHILDHFGTEPYDHAVGTFCRLNGVKLFAASYSLVQHIGRVTTGLGYHHQSKNFADDFF